MQKLTRERLVFAARAVFASDGYHGAKLDAIAREAGFSKGAVYSNFASKADLFLAVMDDNIAMTAQDPEHAEKDIEEFARSNPDFDALVRGFGLATLEFVATAARDEELAKETAKRIQLVVDIHARAAEELGVGTGDVTPVQVGALLTALEQGSAVLALAGVTVLTERAIDAGMRALLEVDGIEAKGSDTPSFHFRETRNRLAQTMGREYLEGRAD